MRCGQCRGGVRGYRSVLHGRPIADWKHTDVPPGTLPHRPILGTPVDKATLDRIHRPETERVVTNPKAPPPQVVLTSPARPEFYAESQSILTMLKLADEEGWEAFEKLYREMTDGHDYIIVKLRRRDLGAVAIWKMTDDDTWLFDEGYTLSKLGYNRVASTSLKTWLKTPDEECPECGCSSIVHTPEGACAA